MLNIIQPVPPSLKMFLRNFEKVLGKHQLKNFQTYLAGLCLELKRKNSQTIDSYKIKENYDSFQHFLFSLRSLEVSEYGLISLL